MTSLGHSELTHWGRVTHICVCKLTIIGSDNSLSPQRRQAIIWTNAGILLIWPLWTNFSEISIDIQTFSFKKIHFKMSSGKCWPFCLGLKCVKTTTVPKCLGHYNRRVGVIEIFDVMSSIGIALSDSRYFIHCFWLHFCVKLKFINGYLYDPIGMYLSVHLKCFFTAELQCMSFMCRIYHIVLRQLC